MKYIVSLLIAVLFLSSCASHRVPAKPSKASVSPKTRKIPKTSKISKVNTPKEGKKVTRAVFHLIHPLGVELFLTNMDDGREERVLVDKTLSQLEVSPGFWQISGFSMDGKIFDPMNGDQQFIFNVKKNQPTYVGSYIIECPKVGKEHLPEMKKMSFFNRYPFTEETGLCELVVGNAYPEVNKVWQKLVKDKKELKLGF